MNNLSRRPFLSIAGRGATVAAATAAVPLVPGSAAAAAVGNQTLRKIVQKRPPQNTAAISLPIDQAEPGGIYVVIYSAQMVNLLVGDTLQVLAEIQGTNHTAEPQINNGKNVQLGTWVTLATSALHTIPLANESYICNPSGANIVSLPGNVGNHYGVPTRVGAITIPDARTWFVNVIAYGLSDGFPGCRDDLLTVLPGYGQLTVMHFR